MLPGLDNSKNSPIVPRLSRIYAIVGSLMACRNASTQLMSSRRTAASVVCSRTCPAAVSTVLPSIGQTADVGGRIVGHLGAHLVGHLRLATAFTHRDWGS